MRDQQEIIQDIGIAASAGNVELLQKLVAEIEPIDTPEARAAMHHGKGVLLEIGHQFSEAAEVYSRGLKICQEQGHTRSAANFHDCLARVFRALGRFDEALASHDHAIQVFRDLGEEHALSLALSNKGVTLQYQNDVPAALEHMMQSLDLANTIGDLSFIGRLKGAIGNLYSDVDDLPSALSLYEEAIEIFQRINDGPAVALYFSNMGGLYHKMGDLAKARELFDRSNALYSEQGNESGMALNHSHIAMCLITEGRDEEGLVQLERSEELNKRTGNVLRMGKLYIDKAQALMRLGRYEDAEKAFDQYREAGIETPQNKILYLLTYAEVFVHQGRMEEARRSCIEAQEICRQIGSKYLEATAVMGLRDYAKADNDLDAYIRYNDEYQRLNDEVHGAEAKLKMAIQAKEREMEAERAERERERAILYSTLPHHVAERLIRGEVINDQFESAAVLFADIVGFTTHSSSMHPAEVTTFLEEVYRRFDAICEEHGVTKVKTIGDSYLCFAGSSLARAWDDNSSPSSRDSEVVIPSASEEPHTTAAERIAAVAIAMQQAEFYWPTSDEQQATSHEQKATSHEPRATSNRLQLRIGVHSGPVSAGVIGTQRMQYDIWGDTVNVASRMESTGEPGRIQCSESFARALCLVPSASGEGVQAPGTRHLILTERGTVDIKGKGPMTTYWLEGA